MSGPAFFQTRMGQRFFEVTIPKIADQLERLNTTLVEIGKALSESHTRTASPDAPTAPEAAHATRDPDRRA